MDFCAIQVLGHNCKGIGSGYGFPEFSTVGANVECAARALDAAQVERSLVEFESCLLGAAGK
jgi:hypothetical protein